MVNDYLKLYIVVLQEVPDHMVPVLVAHTVLGAHLKFNEVNHPLHSDYSLWLNTSFRKCVVCASATEFQNILDHYSPILISVGHENKTLDGVISCIVVSPILHSQVPNRLKYLKLWSPRSLSTKV